MASEKSKFNRNWVIAGIIIIALVIAGVFGYWYLGRSGSGNVETIKIGFEAPLTGAMAWDGLTMLQGAQIAEDYINDNGGILGKKLKIIAEDDQSKPEQGVAAVEKLITKDGCVGIVGCLHSSVAAAIIPVCEKYKVPFMITMSWSDALTAGHSKYVFRTTTYVSANLELYADFIKDSGATNIVCYSYADDYAISMQTGIVDTLKTKWGIDVNKSMYHDVSATDFTADLTKIKADVPNLEIIYTGTLGTGAALMTKQAREMGINALFMYSWDSILQAPDWWEMLGEDNGNYAVDLNTYMPGHGFTNLSQEVATRHLEKFGTEVQGTTLLTFDGVYALAEAIQNAGSTNVDDIITALEALDIPGAACKQLNFAMEATGPNYHQVTPPIFFWQWQNHIMNIVYPDDLKMTDFQWPPGNPLA